jgi:hypothetical protein
VTADAVLTTTGQKRHATVMNMSASGLMLHLPARPDVAVGSRVHVDFLRTGHSGTVKHLSHARHGYYLGLKLDELPERTPRQSAAESGRGEEQGRES